MFLILGTNHIYPQTFLKQTMFITITDFRFTIECPCIECLMLEREWSSVFNVIVTVQTFKMVFLIRKTWIHLSLFHMQNL